MRRKSNRSAAKSTPETKTETRKSTRSSRRRKSPSVEPEECVDASNVEESINDKTPEKPKEKPENTSEDSQKEQKQEQTVEPCVENEDDKGGHTPPRVESTGNEAPKVDEVDAEKGKSKGIGNSQVEENSEINMNSVDACSPEEEIKNEVNTNIDNDNIKEKDELPETQIVDSETKADVVSEDKNIDETESRDENINANESRNENETTDENKSEDKKGELLECDIKSSVKTDSVEKCTENVENSGDINSDSVNEVEQSNNNVEADDAEEGEIRDTKSDEENEKQSKESPRLKAKKTPLKIKLRRSSLFDSFVSEDNPPPAKKMKWDLEAHNCLKIKYHDLHRLDVEDFKTLSSDLKLAEESEVKLEETYHQQKPIRERVKSVDVNAEEPERPEYTKQVSSDDQESTNIIAINRKISIVDDSASKLKPPPSPAKQPASQILFVSNLVRPFTLKQLKELLERTGTIKEGGFWTDRIKSKCYVWYDSIEEAEATRNALHGVHWPVGNGKKLIIDFATEEDMEKARNPPAPPAPQPVVQKTPPRAKTPVKENMEPVFDHRNGEKREERKRKDSERERERPKAPSTREWDLGKESNRDRARSRSRDRRRKLSGRRSPTPLEDFIAKKQKKLEESVPQKLMDDLFQRTKAMPCIYWQPLSPEEISVKQQQRLSRMEEHKRRLEENNTRNRGNAGGPRERGSYRRRYD